MKKYGLNKKSQNKKGCQQIERNWYQEQILNSFNGSIDIIDF